jgi:hypothetical protein
MATESDRFPKRFLSAADLKDKPLAVTIKAEYTEELQSADGEKKSKSILSFKETDKELVLNVTNFDSICDITGKFDTEEWPGEKIELYPDKTRMGGKTVDCVRVRAPEQKELKLKKQTRAPKPAEPAKVDPGFRDEIPFK